MAGRAKSDTKKRQILRDAHDQLMKRAAEAYCNELAKPPGVRRRGLRTICADFERIYFAETGSQIRLSHMTLKRLAEGGRTHTEAKAESSWITEDEANILIDFIIEMGHRGFPLSHRRIKEHVDEICRARLGPKFPASGVGRNWSYRFVEKYSDRIKTKRSRPLEEKRGRAVNPNTNEAWWELLEDTLTKYKIQRHNTYGVDEVGCQPYGEETEWVVGDASTSGPQYEVKSGNRETITVLATICADGTSTPPAIIFKGKAYQVKWAQDNPANASIGYSKKGWTDGEIGVEWMKIFDEQTATKANGEWRLLLVDGHNSHYTLAFLNYARTHMIIVICYPSHTTHIYQGLDVVIFATLKHHLNLERRIWQEKNGTPIDKTNFVGVYGRAHLRAFTAETIMAAFRKTGVWPFNPNVVTEEMMAPSKETSVEGHLPLVPPTPVRTIARLLEKISIEDDLPEDSDEESPGSSPTATASSSAFNTRMRVTFDEAVKKLSTTQLAYLTSINPATSEDAMPTTQTQPIPPPRATSRELFSSIKLKTPNEILLMAALREAEAANDALRQRVLALQATNVLNESYCTKLRFQLAHREEKKKNPKGKGKLVGDGLPRLLTGDDFYEWVVEFTNWQREEERKKKEKKQERARLKVAVDEWKKGEDACKVANAAKTERYHEAVKVWEREKAKAKAAKQTFRIKKPTRQPLQKAKAKPKLADFEQVDGIDDSSEEDDEEDDDDDDDDD
ncbi:Pogo transposable element with KRAB domain [Hypsizygus marmoreus]|uniref:Pogo transposable element with KRAB domain n=1 Tax=Hypsizygus marmoreus TaxID=39966 RepID=A0A369K205_HYPMA|nr:Pogo transposable element with KRAB domain [Hypsizygus marmoreus]